MPFPYKTIVLLSIELLLFNLPIGICGEILQRDDANEIFSSKDEKKSLTVSKVTALGRWVPNISGQLPATTAWGWGIGLKFSGSSKVTFKFSGHTPDNKNNWYGVVVDGKYNANNVSDSTGSRWLSPSSGMHSVAISDPSKNHTVIFVRSTDEWDYRGVPGNFQFDSIELDSGATVYDTIDNFEKPALVYEAWGDSITCGHCSLAFRHYGCSVSGQFSDQYMTYPRFLADMMGTHNWRTICVSGIGWTVTEEYPGLQEFYQCNNMGPSDIAPCFNEKSTEDKFPDLPPADIITMNMGTNDFIYGVPTGGVAAFKVGFNKAIDKALKKNPNAYIFLLTPVIVAYDPYGGWAVLNQTVPSIAKEYGNPQVMAIPPFTGGKPWWTIDEYQSKYFPTDYTHPCVDGHKSMADHYCPVMKQLLKGKDPSLAARLNCDM